MKLNYKEKSYIIITHSNGKRRVYSTEKYLLIRRLKFAGAIIAAIAVMLLMCGMAVVEDHPVMPLQLVFFLGVGLAVLISLIYSYVSYKEPCEKQNKKQIYGGKQNEH